MKPFFFFPFFLCAFLLLSDGVRAQNENRPTIALELSADERSPDIPEKYRDFRGLLIEEFDVIELYPLLTYIFFDSASGEIPERYAMFSTPTETEGFSDTIALGGTLQRYRQVLNIIGYRMRKYPETRITLGGYNSAGGGAPPQPGENLNTSGERQQVIFDYLTTIWQVDPNRIELLQPSSGPAPTRSSFMDPLGLVEYRRAEIRSNDWEIMKPMVVREVRRFHTPYRVRFRLSNGIADEQVAGREIRIRRQGEQWDTITDFGIAGPFSPEWIWYRHGDPELLIAETEAPYVAELIVRDKSGKEHRSDLLEIPVAVITKEARKRERLPDRTIARYSLVLFNFDSDEPGILNERILKEYIYEDIGAEAKVRITGYTDVVGLEDRNQRLSEMRAKAIRKGIERHARDTTVTSMEADGVGETQPLYSNALPEGRFYNRTVQIIVETPKEEE